MHTRGSRRSVAFKCLGAGILVGLLCLVVSIVGALVGPDWAIAAPASLFWIVGLGFAGAGAAGALAFVPFVLWLSSRKSHRVRLAWWMISTALAGAIIGERLKPFAAALDRMPLLPAVLVGAFCGALLGALVIAVVSDRMGSSGSPREQPGT